MVFLGVLAFCFCRVVLRCLRRGLALCSNVACAFALCVALFALCFAVGVSVVFLRCVFALCIALCFSVIFCAVL